MKKSVLAFLFVILVCAGVLYVLQNPSGLEIGGISLGGSDRALIRDRSLKFMEDVKFKDFEKASTYHLPETQKKRDIPKLLHRAFRVRHEVLDIHTYKPVFVELDSSGLRGRVKLMIWYKVLGDQSVTKSERSSRKTEMILYWFKQADGAWAMELESSLRK